MYTITLDATNLSYFDYVKIEGIIRSDYQFIRFNECNNIIKFSLEKIIDDEFQINNFETFLKSIVPKCGLNYNSNCYIPVYNDDEINIFTKDSAFRFQYEKLDNIKIDDLLTIIFKGK